MANLIASLIWTYRILRHKWYVLVEGLRIGAPIWRLLLHDLSKFSPAEFPVYRDKFVKGTVTAAQWKMAANHHLKSNPHHHEWWVWPRDGQEPLPMPKGVILEMIADWLATGREQGSHNISDWFKRSYPTMKLHPNTKFILLFTLNKRFGIEVELQTTPPAQ